MIRSRWVAQGPRVRQFEAAFATRVGASHAIATTSGTSALHLALFASGVGPGDEVIVPSLSFVATANAVWQCGAKPVFADVDPSTYNLDPAAVEAAITDRTKVLMPVHQLGLPADMDAFLDLATRYGLTVVEDAACAVGAEHRGHPIGSLGTIACFSLHARKVITTGEGGMIATDDGELAERLRRLRHHGMNISDLDRHRVEEVVFESYEERGWNFRMTDLQAAIGLCQLDALDEILALRRDRADRYTSALRDLPFVEPPLEPDGYTHSWQTYAVRLAPRVDRRRLMHDLLRDGVATRRGVAATHLTPAYRGSRQHADLPQTEAADRQMLLLPLFCELSDEQSDHVLSRLAHHLEGG